MKLETERRQARRYWTIPRALTFLLAGTLLAFALTFGALLTFRVLDLMRSSDEAGLKAQADAAAYAVSNQLSGQLAWLRHLAASPRLGRALRERAEGFDADLASVLTSPFDQVRLAAVDTEGRALWPTGESPAKTSQLGDLLSGAVARADWIIQRAGTDFWVSGTAIAADSFTVPGVLLAETKVEWMCAAVDWAPLAATIRAELRYDGRVLCSWGQNRSGRSFYRAGPVPGSHISIQVSDEAAAFFRAKIPLEIAALASLLLITIGGFSIRIARRRFMEPIGKLESVARDFELGRPCLPLVGRQWLKELDDLAHRFSRMAERIAARERELIESRDELAEANALLVRSQQRLVQSEKMASLGTLAAGVAHEINNPMGVVMSNLSTLAEYQAVLAPLARDYQALIAERAEDEPELARRFESQLQGEDLGFLLDDLESLTADTLDGGRRVAAIVAGLRTFAHAGEGSDEAVDLNECVRSALMIANNELKYRAKIELDLNTVPRIRGSSGQMTQVFVNLLVNAAQAIEAQGAVRVSTSVESGRLIARVSDTGCGIAPEHMPQLFTPFFTTKKVGVGTGLGLSISHGIITAYGGGIEVESQVGEGTRFILSFPIDHAETGAPISDSES